MGLTLYEIQAEIDNLLGTVFDLSEETGGEIPDQLGEELEGLQLDRDKKLGNICRYIKNLRAEAKVCDDEAKILQARARTKTNRSKWLTEYLDGVLNGQKWTDGISQVSYRKSTAVIIDDEKAVPEEHLRTKVEISKTSIKDALKAEKPVPGARLLTRNKIQVK